MSDNISHIRATVDSLVKTLSQLPIMEEKSRGQSEAIGRAFAEIDELREGLEHGCGVDAAVTEAGLMTGHRPLSRALQDAP